MDGPSIRTVARWLRREFPPPPGTGKVQVLRLGDVYGYATPDGRVLINSRYAKTFQRETLLHEWAHLRVGWSDRHEHPLRFWMELGRITNAYHDWREDED